MSDTLMRQWQMLRMVPRHPSKISTTELMNNLSLDGFDTTQRTIQRDLERLSSIYPLDRDERSKPFGWFWSADAAVLDVPGMDTDTALAFYLAEKHLEPLLPPSTTKRMQPHFRKAESMLDQFVADNGVPAWRNKVRVLQRGPGLKCPTIRPEVQTSVYEGLLRGRRLHVTYLPRGASTSKQYELNPLGLVLKDGLFYLVCSMWDYTDIRLITLHRLQQASVLDIPSQAPEGFDLDAYIAAGELDFAIGGDIRLKARINKQVSQHLEERPLNGGQVISQDDDASFLLDVTTQDTSELRWWLLGFGDSIEILEPADLREEFRQIANHMAAAYAAS